MTDLPIVKLAAPRFVQYLDELAKKGPEGAKASEEAYAKIRDYLVRRNDAAIGVPEGAKDVVHKIYKAAKRHGLVDSAYGHLRGNSPMLDPKNRIRAYLINPDDQSYYQRIYPELQTKHPWDIADAKKNAREYREYKQKIRRGQEEYDSYAEARRMRKPYEEYLKQWKTWSDGDRKGPSPAYVEEPPETYIPWGVKSRHYLSWFPYAEYLRSAGHGITHGETLHAGHEQASDVTRGLFAREVVNKALPESQRLNPVPYPVENGAKFPLLLSGAALGTGALLGAADKLQKKPHEKTAAFGEHKSFMENVTEEAEKATSRAKAQKALTQAPLHRVMGSMLTGEYKGEDTGRAVPLATTVGRIGLTGMGAGSLINYLPLVKMHTLGERTLWHGTRPEYLTEGETPILRHGLLTQYAGQQQRFNSDLMASHTITMLEDKLGKRLPEADRLALINSVKVKGKSADSLIETAQAIAKRHSLDDKGLGNELLDAGKRIYFGSAPHQVTEWGSHGTETDMAIKQLLARGTAEAGEGALTKEQAIKNFMKRMALMGGDVLAGGIPSLVKAEGVNRYRMHKALSELSSTEVASHDEAMKHIRDYMATVPEENRKHISAVMGATLNKNVKDVVGRTGAESLATFKDFPVVGDMIAMSPQVRSVVSEFLPNYTPGRDISVSGDIPTKNIHSIYLFDMSDVKNPKAVKRIHIKGADIPKVTLAPNLKRLAFPAAVSLAGAEMLAKGITGKTMTGRLIDHWSKPEEEKTAALKRSTMEALKKGLRAGGYGAAGLGAVALPIGVATDFQRRRMKEKGYEGSEVVLPIIAAKTSMLPFLSQAAGTGIGIRQIAKSRHVTPGQGYQNMTDFGGTMMLGQTAGAPAGLVESVTKQQAGLSPVPQRLQDKAPNTAAAVTSILPAAGVLGAATYVGSKYYAPSIEHSDKLTAIEHNFDRMNRESVAIHGKPIFSGPHKLLQFLGHGAKKALPWAVLSGALGAGTVMAAPTLLPDLNKE